MKGGKKEKKINVPSGFMNVSLIFSLCDLWKLFMEQFVKALRTDDNSSHIIHDMCSM